MVLACLGDLRFSFSGGSSARRRCRSHVRRVALWTAQERGFLFQAGDFVPSFVTASPPYFCCCGLSGHAVFVPAVVRCLIVVVLRGFLRNNCVSTIFDVQEC